jgi:hypothetical protein
MKTPTAVPANKTFRFEVVQWREQAISPAGSGWQPLEPQAVVFGQNVTGGAPGVPANTLEDIDMTFLTTLNESHLFALPDCYYLEIRWLDDSNKVLYSEVDGLSIPDQLEHLGSLQTSPGRVSRNIPICSGSPPPIGSEPSAIQVGGIHSNVRPPDVPTVPTDG